jgi:rhodanese-related sulfurtransferase
MVKSITMQEFEQELQNGTVELIDVREEDEYEGGHIKGATNIPLYTIPNALYQLDKQKNYHVICLSGGRSYAACEYMEAKGFQVINVIGGMSAWRGAVE